MLNGELGGGIADECGWEKLQLKRVLSGDGKSHEAESSGQAGKTDPLLQARAI